jgi:hypothetical protein
VLIALALGAGCYDGLEASAASGSQSSSADEAGTADDGDDDGVDDGSVPEGYEPAPVTMRRLTTAQYHNSIADVFGTEVVVHVELDPDEGSDRFSSIGASEIGTSEQGVQRYRDAAFDVAAQVFARRDVYPTLAACRPETSADPCVGAVLRELGRKLWRRAPTDAEIARYAALVDAEYEDGFDPELGLQYAIAGLVESPNFVYVVQLGEPDANTGMLRFTSHEMASRLSYFLWDSTPDEALLAAAEADELRAPAEITVQADRMLATPRGQAVLARFFGEAWKVGDLDLPDKDPGTYAVWTESFVASAHDEFARTLSDVLAKDGDLRELFTGRRTFVDAQLAAFYGIAGSPDPTMAVDLPPERTGLLTSVAVIGANSPANRSSVVFRGKFVFERLLCEPIPPPPDDVDTSNPSADRTQPPCSSCHELLDPLGVTFEHFDGVAGWRDEQDGVPVDAVGTYAGATFDGAVDLAAWLVEDPRLPQCLARQAFEYAAGRVPTDADEPLLDEMTAALEDGGFAPRDLLLAVVTSPAFRYLAPPE